MKIGILASGGNSPAMNNCVLSLTKAAQLSKHNVVWIYNGFQGIYDGLFKKPDIRTLEYLSTCGNILIGTSRCKEFYDVAGKKKALGLLRKQKIDVLICIGGDGTYQGAWGLCKLGMKVMALPGTIDNDIASTNSTIGFYTCLNTIVEYIDAMRDSFDSHSGIGIVEVMGRRFSDLAVQAGIATNAEVIITPDNIMNSEQMINAAKETFKNGKRSCIFVVTEGIYGAKEYPPLAQIAKDIEAETGRVTRLAILGHAQRGGIPSAIDRLWAMLMGNYCIKCIDNKKFNRAIGEKHRELIDVNLGDAVALPRKKNKVELALEFERLNKI